MAFKKNNRGSYVLTGEDGQEFTVTKSEYQQLQTLTKRANQRRVDRAHAYYDKLSETDFMTGKSYDGYMKLLNDKGFITEKYSTSLKQFKSKADVKSQLKELQEVTKRGYGNARLDDIRYKMLEQINTNYGSNGEELYNRIENLSDSELLSFYLTADKDILNEVFYLDADVQALSNQDLATVDSFLAKNSRSKALTKYINDGNKNSKAENDKKKTSKSGWQKFKNKSTHKKSMKEKRINRQRAKKNKK